MDLGRHEQSPRCYSESDHHFVALAKACSLKSFSFDLRCQPFLILFFASLDVQFVVDAFGCVRHVDDYYYFFHLAINRRASFLCEVHAILLRTYCITAQSTLAADGDTK